MGFAKRVLRDSKFRTTNPTLSLEKRASIALGALGHKKNVAIVRELQYGQHKYRCYADTDPWRYDFYVAEAKRFHAELN